MFNKLLTANPRPWGILFSVLLSLLLGWNALVNSDGILYLRSAAAFAHNDFHTAVSIYPWAFYASLIAFVSQISSLTLEHAAVVINALLYGVMMAGFITLIKKMGGDRMTQWAAVIVLIANPALNDYREYIIRDFGQWAMLPWALYFYMCCFEKVTLRHALGWTLCMIIALLFRIEALVVLVLAPAMLLLIQRDRPFSARIIHAAKLYSITMLMGIIGIAMLISQHKIEMLNRFLSLKETLRFIVTDTGALFTQHIHTLSDHLSVFLKPEQAGVILIGGLIVYVIFTLVKLLNLVYTPMAIATLYKKWVPEPQFNACIGVFIALYTLIVAQHLSQHYFLSSRYVIPLALCFMPWVPFALVHLLEHSARWRWALSLVFVYLFISGVTHFGYSKEYLRQAGSWVQEHTRPHVSILSNSRHVLYYTHRDLDWDKALLTDQQVLALKPEQLAEHPILVIVYGRKDKDVQSWLTPHEGHVLARYENERGDGVVIFVGR